MIIPYCTLIGTWLCRFFYVQCFLSLISLPILIQWGLPISLYSVLGNLIFSPIITIFLLLSCSLFFCHLFCLPTTLCIHLLEYTTLLWHTLLNYAKHDWLIAFAQPSLPLLYIAPVAAFCIAYTMRHHSLVYKTSMMFLAVICITGTLAIQSGSTHCIQSLTYGNSQLYIVQKDHQLMLIDTGIIGQRLSVSSWLQYTLVPHILRTTGRTSIDHVILLKATDNSIKTVIGLTTKMRIHRLYLPCSSQNFDKQWTYALASRSINVVFLEDVIRASHHELANTGIFRRLEKAMKTNNDLWHPFMFQTTIDNKLVTIYPSGYTKRNKNAQ